MIGIVIVLVFTVGYKIIYKTRIRDPKTADLRTGRRTLGREEIDLLNAYYGKSAIRRFWTYVQLW